ncbi:hypothetical protein HNQ61_003689 [Longimicrobium terrae]|uniref:Uncharacterized protein n=2 Tax=Longimicrobium terrae TaxID=1639882 RepID=A0A841H230_9BACT|nr:hypothetical protein [Longimicrobium terrae]MBB6072028.1 hypothetical protein [Longimicrobium terrae]
MRWMMMAACASLVAGSAAAQTTPADTTACGGNGAGRAVADSVAGDSAGSAMIRIDARFTAESIRLNAPASARVVVPGCAPGSGVRVERQNLPERLEPGTTYRNGGMRIIIQADAVLACRLAAALAAPTGTSAAAGLDQAICGPAPDPAAAAPTATTTVSPSAPALRPAPTSTTAPPPATTPASPTPAPRTP